jgi:hypothetical protein
MIRDGQGMGSVERGPPGSLRMGPPEALSAAPVDDGLGPSYRRCPDSVSILLLDPKIAILTIDIVGTKARDSSNLVNLDAPACKRLISRTFSPQEVTSLIEAIFMSKDEVRMVRDLRGDDAQTFIDVIHEVRSPLFLPRHILITCPLPLLPSNFHLPDQAWISQISNRSSGGRASVSYAGYAAVRLYFRDHCESRFATIDSIPRCITAGLPTCGRVNTKVATSRSRY